MSLFRSPLLRAAKDLLKEIEAAGYEAYIVGGAARDLIMSKTVSDVDIATNCPIKQLQYHFRAFEIGRGTKFGVVGVVYYGFPFEIAQFRRDGEYTNRRSPDEVYLASTLEEDVSRRDFTINGLALTSKGEFIDYVGALDDIESGIIRAIGNPYERFYEDPVRMIRAARFAARFNFPIERNTRRVIRRLFKDVSVVTPERLRLELTKAASGTSEVFAKFIEILVDLKLLAQILPEVDALRFFEHNREHHPEGRTVFEHTTAAIRAVPDFCLHSTTILLATLFHDLGKAISLTEVNGLPKYYSHGRKSGQIAESICKRLTFSSFETDAIVYATTYHMDYRKAHEMRPAKIARMVSSDFFPILVEVCRADDKSRGDVYYDHAEFENHLAGLKATREKWSKFLLEKKEKLVDGKRIMEITGLRPGPRIGKIKEEVENTIIDLGLDHNDPEVIDELIKKTNLEIEGELDAHSDYVG